MLTFMFRLCKLDVFFLQVYCSLHFEQSDADPEAEDSEEKPTDPVVPVPTSKPIKLWFSLSCALSERKAEKDPIHS